MSSIEDNKKPCLVQTTQGFSVSYNNRFLYSKYNPSKLIEEKISSLDILSGTLILCFSPVLDYGLPQLIAKINSLQLSESVQLLICEFDPELREFINSQKKQNLPVLSEEELYNLPIILNSRKYTFGTGHKLLGAGTFKRILRIDFSAGVQFNSLLYDKLEEACINSIKTFWANRVTLVKFGRKYTHNLFLNLKLLQDTIPIENFFTSISKPIIIFGASQSLELPIAFLQQFRQNFYILCVDTALQPLLLNQIIPDGVFIEEAQNVISKAFIGCSKLNIHIFAGISSVPIVNRLYSSEKVSFFTSLYTDSSFLTYLNESNILPYANKPFGSVGLTSVFYALKFRINNNIPVIYYGLDFSYTAGFTHARGTVAHVNRLLNANRLNSIDNLTACFGNNSVKLKNSSNYYSTQNLSGYQKLFYGLFNNTQNFYDGRKITLDKTYLNIETAESTTNVNKTWNTTKLSYFFENEKKSLEYLKNLLTGKTELSGEDLKKEICHICEEKDYLYLHFPDGWKFSYTQSFLNRIRTEIDFFLKIL